MTNTMVTLLLAAALGTGPAWKQITLDWGHLRMMVPANAHVTRERINWETDRYIVQRGTDDAELLDVVVGGGTVDLKHFTPFCLNHKRAWRSKKSHPVTVVVGRPGVDAAYLTSTDVSDSGTAKLDRMISSVKFFDGAYCR